MGLGAERGAAAPASALPCLSSNICTKAEKSQLNVLSGAQKRTAFIVAFEIQRMAEDFGIEHIGFFTLTFKDHVTDIGEAQKRFRSLRAHVIAKRYKCAIGVWERHQSGRIHFHLVVALEKDIRTGLNFSALKRKDYQSVNSALRTEWAFWRQTCPKYRFGRHELLPIKSNAEGIARYVGKYISKHIRQRLPEDKGARVVRFIGYKPGMRRACRKFSWNSGNGWLWRQKTKALAGRYGLTGIEQMRITFGPRWAYHLQEQILGERLEGMVFPSRNVGLRSFDQGLPLLTARSRANDVLETIPATQTRLLREGKFNRENPVWAVPWWYGEKIEIERTNSGQIQEPQENARQWREFIAQMPPWSKPCTEFKAWIEQTAKAE
jgi:hypothetical protein